jgi:hypothetical protein
MIMLFMLMMSFVVIVVFFGFEACGSRDFQKNVTI